MKFIHIWKYNEQMQRELEESKEPEQSIGPKNFVPILKIGQGSFG